MRSISGDDLKGWDVSWYEAMEAAKSALSEMEFAVARIGDHLYASASGDNYDASRLILTDLIQQMDVYGDHVAMVPNRDTLLVTGSNDETGLQIMADLAEKALEDPRPLGATPPKFSHIVEVTHTSPANSWMRMTCVLGCLAYAPPNLQQDVGPTSIV